MRGKCVFISTLLVCTIFAVTPRIAAAQATRADSLEARIRELEARIDSLVAALQRGDTAHGAVDQLAALRAAARKATQSQPTPDTAGQISRTRSLQALNPEISVTGDVVGDFTAPAGPGDNVTAVPREFEFSFQAALDPYTHTKIFATREEEFPVAGLPEPGAGAGAEGGFEIEEAYMYWVGLPGGLGAKIGKMRQQIGLYNRWHTHALFEVDRPLTPLTFLGDGLIQTGGSVTLPSLTLGPATQTLTAEVTRGSNEPLFDGGNQMSYLLDLQSFWDLSAASYFQVGATGVYGENDGESLVSRLLALAMAYRWRPPGRSLYRDVSLKAEWYFAQKDYGSGELTGNGGYLQANYRLTRRWIVGARADYLNGYDAGPEIVQLAPSLTWWQSEWVRLRLQYNYVKPNDGASNHTVLFQSVWAVGPHKHETY